MPSSRSPPAGSAAQDAGEVAALVEQDGRLGQLGRDEPGHRVGRHGRVAPDRSRRTSARCARRARARCSGRRGPRRSSTARRASGGPSNPGRSCRRRRCRGRWRSPTTASGPAAGWHRRSLTPSSGRSTSGVTKPVAEIASSTSIARSAPPSVRRRWTVSRPSGAPLDPVDRGVEHADPTAEDVILVRLDVAGTDTDQGLGVDRQADLRRRRDDQLARPRQQAGRQLEPGVLLADDQDPVVGVVLDRPDVGVVVGVLHADPGRRIRLGHADRDDEDPARCRCRRSSRPRTGRRRASPPGACPSSGCRTGSSTPARSANSGEVGLHLGTRREVRRAVHERRLEGARLRRRRRAGCSSRSARRSGCRARPGACGLVHDRRRWKNGQRRNIPPGDGSAEMTAWSTPSRRSEYDTWRAPGPLPTTTTGYSPGGNGPLSSAIGSRPAAGGPAPGASAT